MIYFFISLFVCLACVHGLLSQLPLTCTLSKDTRIIKSSHLVHFAIACQGQVSTSILVKQTYFICLHSSTFILCVGDWQQWS